MPAHDVAMSRKSFQAVVVVMILVGLVLVILHFVRLELPNPEKMEQEQAIRADMVNTKK